MNYYFARGHLRLISSRSNDDGKLIVISNQKCPWNKESGRQRQRHRQRQKLIAISPTRNVLGTKNLGDILSERESIAHEMKVSVREKQKEMNYNIALLIGLNIFSIKSFVPHIKEKTVINRVKRETSDP